MRKWKEFLREEEGQSMTEYVILLLLIAIALISAWKFFGSKLYEKVRSAGEKLDELDVE